MARAAGTTASLPPDPRVQRGTPDQVAQSHLASILRDTAPQQSQGPPACGGRDRWRRAPAPECRPQRLVRRKAELLLRVVARGAAPPSRPTASGRYPQSVVPRSPPAGLLPADARNWVELIGVQTSLVGAIQTLAKLQVEYFEAEPARGLAILAGLSQPHTIAAHLGMNTRMCDGNFWDKNCNRRIQKGDGSGRSCRRNLQPYMRNHGSSIPRKL